MNVPIELLITLNLIAFFMQLALVKLLSKDVFIIVFIK